MINTLRDREDDARGSRIIWNAVETSRLLKNLRDIFDKILPEGLGGWAVDVDRTIYHREMSLPRGWLKNPWKVEARVDALMRTDCDGFIQERRRRSSRRPSRKRHDDRLFFFFPSRFLPPFDARARTLTSCRRFTRINWNILPIINR